MLIFAFKLFATPLLIGAVTLAGRRWGAITSGLLIGLPLTSGPISFILACQYGLDFASRSAVGNLAGQISNCLFCLTYIGLARSCNWLISALASIAVFFAATWLWNTLTWQLWPAFVTLLVVIVLSARLVPHHRLQVQSWSPPKWDLPARIATATGLVVLLTSVANDLGPQLSGLISPFPAFSVIFAAFTHSQQGAKSASNLLRGVIVGSASYALFFLVVGLLLNGSGIALTYALACGAAVSFSGLFYLFTRQFNRSH